jgi:hypothetical protein
MKWIKKGLIYNHSSTQPSPILLDKNTIRVYAGFRDTQGVSRIGYVDVDAADPSNIRRISKKPVLNIGKPGTFDDNGVILGDVVTYGKTLRMYYVGFQHVQKVKFLAFSGLAISHDHGETFTRVSDTPIFDRAPGELYIRTIHTVIREKNHWDIWYSSGNSWEIIKGLPYPRYSIFYTQSKDGISIPNSRIICIAATKKEYRIGRPRVYKDKSGYYMFYTIGTVDKTYLPGYARSPDGIHWHRKDRTIGIAPSATGWDSQMLCYPSLIHYKTTTYMFYNGNGMGESGFGYAILAGT